MITTAQYEKALTRLMELNNLYTVPGDKEDIEKEYLTELVSEYETQAQEFEYVGWPGDGSGEDDFADYNQNEGNDW
jgi:hypothetical protein